MQARFVSGNYNTTQYTPEGAVSAGDIIVEGDKCYIAHDDIAAGVQGTVATGGGIYEVLKDGSSGPVFSMGDKAYWDDSGNLAEDTATSTTPLGWFAGDAGTSDATVLVEHGAF